MDSLYKCVWMTGGLLTYRLCDRDYDCERCLIDRAMREGGMTPPEPTDRFDAFLDQEIDLSSGFPSASGRFYDPTHQQVQIVGGGAARVGLDPLLSRIIGSAQRFHLPAAAAGVRRNQVAWTIDCDAGRVELPSPIGGTVEVINERLLGESPASLGDRSADLWLAVVRPKRLRADLARLLFGPKARVWWCRELEKVRELLVSLRRVEGGTLPDGGETDLKILDRLPAETRRLLVAELLRDRDR